MFPKDLAGVPPREFAERFFAVERFTVMPRGGHFAALEQPELLAEDLIGFLARPRLTVCAGMPPRFGRGVYPRALLGSPLDTLRR